MTFFKKANTESIPVVEVTLVVNITTELTSINSEFMFKFFCQNLSIYRFYHSLKRLYSKMVFLFYTILTS